MISKRSLGRSLNELLSDIKQPATSETTASATHQHQQRSLPIDVLQPGKYQPRKDMNFDALQELANSIRAQGIIQPIVVRSIAPGSYEIIAGERRWRAAQLTGLMEVPVIVREISDEAAIAMSLIENIQREDLNAIEEAVALQRLGDEFGMTHENIAAAVGKSRATVSNLLRLLNLNTDVKTLVEHGDLEMGHARALLALSGMSQSEAAKLVVSKGLSVRDTESLTRKWGTKTAAKTNKVVQSPDITRLQQELSEKLAAQVTLQHQSKGKGKMIIQYYSLDELQGILARIR